MCGRFTLTAPSERVISHFKLTNNVVLKPRYNIAPSQPIPVIRTVGVVDFLAWGFRPSWLAEDKPGFINARSETLSEKPAFKKAFRKQRCLIIADGYFEWKAVGKKKQPFYITLQDKSLLALAGIWDGDTCGIITMEAKAELASIHQRMPVIIAEKYYEDWLSPQVKASQIEAMMKTTTLFNFEYYSVSTVVNNPKIDGKECIAAL